MQNSTINQIIKLCIKGDEMAQMQLYDQYSKAMYQIACRYLGDEDAKDAMQEGFLKAFKKMSSYTSEFSFGAWLKRIIINQCIDVLKKRRLETSSFEEEKLEIIDDTSWSFDSTITKQMIIAAIETLNEKYKLVVKLYLMEGYDHEEISVILNIPRKTSRTHLRRAKLKLQEILKVKLHETGY